MGLARRVVATVVALAMGCGPSVTVRRMGRPIPLETGEPRDACERSGFLEMVPSEGRATSAIQAGSMLYTGWAEARGLSLYKTGEKQPQLLLPLFSGPGDQELMADHLLLMQPTLEKRNNGLLLAYAVGGTTIAGLGLIFAAAADQGAGGSTYNLLGWSGVAVLLGGIVVALPGLLASRVRPDDLSALMIRERMLIPSEVNVESFRRAVSDRNQQVRDRCLQQASP